MQHECLFPVPYPAGNTLASPASTYLILRIPPHPPPPPRSTTPRFISQPHPIVNTHPEHAVWMLLSCPPPCRHTQLHPLLQHTWSWGSPPPPPHTHATSTDISLPHPILNTHLVHAAWMLLSCPPPCRRTLLHPLPPRAWSWGSPLSQPSPWGLCLWSGSVPAPTRSGSSCSWGRGTWLWWWWRGRRRHPVPLSAATCWLNPTVCRCCN